MPASGLSGVFFPLSRSLFFFKQQEPETAPSQLLLFHQTGVAPAGSSHSWLRQQTQSEPCGYKSQHSALGGQFFPNRAGHPGAVSPMRENWHPRQPHRGAPAPIEPGSDKGNGRGCRKTLSGAIGCYAPLLHMISPHYHDGMQTNKTYYKYDYTPHRMRVPLTLNN